MTELQTEPLAEQHEHHEAQHGAEHPPHAHGAAPARILTIRAVSGLSGDMFLAGLTRMTATDEPELNRLLAAILPELDGSVHLVRKQINHIGGWHANVTLPHQHEHRTLGNIADIITKSGLSSEGKRLALDTFVLLARTEAFVHDKQPEAIHFHEVGALDSILDICLTCELFARLAPARFVVSPLPMADGAVRCAHGRIPTPAPAVLELLAGLPVRSFSAEGETVTPTAAALLHTLSASFGPWPTMLVEKTALVFGSRVFPDVPNGAIFACGTEWVE